MYLVCSGGAKVARDHHLPDEVLALGQHCQCGEQPAVAQNAWNQEDHLVNIKGILSSPDILVLLDDLGLQLPKHL